jgi:hypothetical protein
MLRLPRVVFFLVAPASVWPSASTAQAPQGFTVKRTLDAAVGAILQADGPTAVRLLSGIRDADLNTTDRDWRLCMLTRLTRRGSETLKRRKRRSAAVALDAYRDYWFISVAYPEARDEAESRLIHALSGLLRHDVKTVADAEPLLSSRLRHERLYSLEGKTGLLHELMLWKRQRRRIEHVVLPEGSVDAPVFYLDGFISRGWSSYFTCDHTGTGGWTNDKGLFVVVPSYNSLKDENFRVNFLAHESQHLADKKRFPGLQPWELEFRAKLVELAYTTKTRASLLSRLTVSQGDNPEDAHSYANKRVLSAMRMRLGLSSDADLMTVPIGQLNASAIDELKADTERRMRRPN